MAFRVVWGYLRRVAGGGIAGIASFNFFSPVDIAASDRSSVFDIRISPGGIWLHGADFDAGWLGESAGTFRHPAGGAITITFAVTVTVTFSLSVAIGRYHAMSGL